jgi:hypothetical protein
MAGSPAGTGSNNISFDHISTTSDHPSRYQNTSPFFSIPSTMYPQQTHPGGVGTTVPYDNATDSSFASSPSPGIMTPASTSSMSPYNTPLAFPAAPAIPQTPGSDTSDQDNESSSSDTSKTKEYRCDVKGCKSKTKVFKLACQLRYASRNLPLFRRRPPSQPPPHVAPLITTPPPPPPPVNR